MMKILNKFKYQFLIGGLLIAIISTTAVSFVYWKSQLTGSSTDRDLNINIGEGEAIETEIELSNILVGNKALVPQGRVVDAEEQTDLITFSVSITWVAEKQLTGTDLTNFEAHPGQLTAKCSSIMLSEEQIELKGVLGLGEVKLFNVDFDKEFYNINGNQSKNVQVSISMNEPADKAQYELIAGKGITIKLVFEIQSQYDLGNYR